MSTLQKSFMCVSYLWSDGPWRQAPRKKWADMSRPSFQVQTVPNVHRRLLCNMAAHFPVGGSTKKAPANERTTRFGLGDSGGSMGAPANDWHVGFFSLHPRAPFQRERPWCQPSFCHRDLLLARPARCLAALGRRTSAWATTLASLRRRAPCRCGSHLQSADRKTSLFGPKVLLIGAVKILGRCLGTLE